VSGPEGIGGRLRRLATSFRGGPDRATRLGAAISGFTETESDPHGLAEALMRRFVEGEEWERGPLLGVLIVHSDLPAAGLLSALYPEIVLPMLRAPDPFDPEGFRTLEELYFEAIAQRLGQAGGRRGRWILRHEALRPGRAGLLIDTLQRDDAAWVKANAAELTRSDPELALADPAPPTEDHQARGEREPATRARLLRTIADQYSAEGGDGGAARLHLLEESAALGDVEAATAAGWMRLVGAGCEQSVTDTIDLFLQAARNEHAPAAFYLGRLLVDEPSLVPEGLFWLRQASDAGHEEAVSLLAHIDGDEDS
jgi:hypothetical protein